MLIYALVAGVLFGLYFSLVGIGLNLVFGVMRIVNLAHGDMLMLGAFIAFGVVAIAGVDTRTEQACASGGAPLPVAVKERWDSVVGCPIFEGWGMTETSPIGTFTPRSAPFRPGSCGIPYPGTLMKLVDVVDSTREVPLGERGEICVKGPNIMKGYWKKPEETANAMTTDGFFRTGDVGTMDEDGYVYIVDRTKDMLLCGGFNVYPRNIEEAIYQHPSVEEVSASAYWPTAS